MNTIRRYNLQQIEGTRVNVAYKHQIGVYVSEGISRLGILCRKKIALRVLRGSGFAVIPRSSCPRH